MRDPEANPFPAADTARRAIWEMLVPRDIDAFLAADWALVEGDFVEANFTGLNARFLPSPDAWRLSFPTLAAYRDEWLRQAREAKAAREAGLYAEDARAAIFRATRLEEIEIDGAAALVRKRFDGGIRRADGGLDRMNWQTLYICRLRRRALEDRGLRRLPAAREGLTRCAIFTAALATETNTFSPIFIDRRGFEDSLYAPPGQHPETPTLCTAPITVGRRVCRGARLDADRGHGGLGRPGGAGEPGDLRGAARRDPGPARGGAAGRRRGARAARRDGGARATTTRRAICWRGCARMIGPDVLLCAELDPHSHLTAKRVAAADFFTVFKEFPHTDFVDRAEDLWRIAADTLEGRVRPVMSVFDCRMIDVFPTSREPMRGFVDRMLAIERDGRPGAVAVGDPRLHGRATCRRWGRR